MKGLTSFKKILEKKFKNTDFKQSFDKFCVKDIIFEFLDEVDLKEYIKDVKVNQECITIICSNFLVSNKINTLKNEIKRFLKEKGSKKEFQIKIKNR